MLTAHGVPMAVSSRTNEVIAVWASRAKCPANTQAMATTATAQVARARDRRGRMASRSRPIEQSIRPASPTDPAEAASSSGSRYQAGAAPASGPA